MIKEQYILPIDHPISIENIRRKMAPCEKFDNIFSKDELTDIWKRAFTDAHPSARIHKNGTIIISGGLEKIYHDFKDKIDKCVGLDAEKSPAISGNFFITPQQYGLHIDSVRKEDFDSNLKKVPLNDERRKYTCWRNFILPLWIGTTHFNENDAGQFVAFEQRHVDWAKVYNGGNKIPKIGTIYDIVTDYSSLQWYDGQGKEIPKDKNSKLFDLDLYKKYLTTFPYERLNGLTIEAAVDWLPGTPIVFDAVQLHLSNSGSERGVKTWLSKMGLLLTFLVELDEDLLIEWRKEQKKM